MAKLSSRLRNEKRKRCAISVETSMNSHPLYAGPQRIIDTGGRVEQFNKQYRVLGASGGRRAAAGT